MIPLSRRTFLAGAATTVALSAVPFGSFGMARATPLGIPAGVQLWTVKEELAKDFEGTLKALHAIGYERVESAGWFDRTPEQFRTAVSNAGLECTSSHYSLASLMEDTDAKLAFARDVGAQFCVASSPAPRRPIDSKRPWSHGVAEAMTLADWRANADAMNKIGAKAKALGIRFGYHNHSAEFLRYDGVEAFDELLRLTDPELVSFELDLGWVAAAGMDPVHVLEHHGDRIRLLHVKDIATRERTPHKIVADETTVPIGKGTIDWPAVFAAAAKAPIHSYFVEQEAPFTQPPLDALKESIAYLNTFKA